MTCPSPSSLRSHIKFRHSNEKPYSCEYCEYRCFVFSSCDRATWDHPHEWGFNAFSCLPFVAVRIWSTCVNTWTPTASIRRSAATFPGVASRLVHPAPWRFTTRRSMRWALMKQQERISAFPPAKSSKILCFCFFRNQGTFTARYKCHVCGQCFTRGNSLTVHLHKKHQFKWPSGHPRFRYVSSLSRWLWQYLSPLNVFTFWLVCCVFLGFYVKGKHKIVENCESEAKGCTVVKQFKLFTINFPNLLVVCLHQVCASTVKIFCPFIFVKSPKVRFDGERLNIHFLKSKLVIFLLHQIML